jgi:hypothetical protein
MTRIHITTGSKPRRPKPRVGDRKLIRGVEHVRVFERVTIGPHRGAYVVDSRGRPRFEWVPVEKPNEYPCGYMQQRGAA